MGGSDSKPPQSGAPTKKPDEPEPVVEEFSDGGDYSVAPRESYNRHLNEYEYKDRYLVKAPKYFLKLYEKNACPRLDVRNYVSRGYFKKTWYGGVHLVEDERSSKDIVVKRLMKNVLKRQKKIYQVIREKKVLYACDNKFITGLNYVWQDSMCLFMVYEFQERGDLTLGRTPDVLDSIGQMVLALEYLHACGVVHRNLKAENILRGRDNYLRLGGFGHCKRIGDGRTESIVGELRCWSPQLVEKQAYGFDYDIWLLGLFAYELYHNGQHPFCKDRFDDERNKKNILTMQPSLNQTERNINQLITSCLAKDVDTERDSRISIQGVRKLGCFRGTNFLLDLYNKSKDFGPGPGSESAPNVESRDDDFGWHGVPIELTRQNDFGDF